MMTLEEATKAIETVNKKEQHFFRFNDGKKAYIGSGSLCFRLNVETGENFINPKNEELKNRLKEILRQKANRNQLKNGFKININQLINAFNYISKNGDFTKVQIFRNIIKLETGFYCVFDDTIKNTVFVQGGEEYSSKIEMSLDPKKILAILKTFKKLGYKEITIHQTEQFSMVLTAGKSLALLVGVRG